MRRPGHLSKPNFSLSHQEIESSWGQYRNGSIENVKAAIEGEKQAQHSAKGEAMLFDAKRENVGLQLEATYRERLAKAHSEVRWDVRIWGM